MHGTDIQKLISILRSLAEAGNCVCVVEHDEEVIKSADRVVEMGPLPGNKGGKISFNGSIQNLKSSKKGFNFQMARKNSLPEYLRLRKRIIGKNSPQLHIVNASKHNIKNLSTTIPLSKLVCIAGVSGSGKSTFAQNIIYEGMTSNTKTQTIKSDILFNETILVDQSSVVKSPRSNPALYSDSWGPIKEAFGRTESAKRLGFSSADFSFNGGNGRCDSCSGLGYEQVEMQFLSDIQLP